MGIPSIETGVFGGIIVGLIAAWCFNRFYKIKLPPYLGFFAGKRSVPIITSFAVIGVGAILSFIWPPIGNGIDAFSHWAVHEQPALAFTIYGVVERALIPFGLHHVWNVPFFFQAGDLHRSRDRQCRARRDRALHRRRSDRRTHDRRLSLQDVGPAGGGDRDLALRPVRRTAPRSAAS